jgi:hypothetical protein
MSEFIDSPLPDEILQQIARQGRNYPHEGRSMAKELIAFRKAREEAAKAAAAAPTSSSTPVGLGGLAGNPGLPFPWGAPP